MRILDHFEQGSAEWYEQRRGRITMSHAKELLTGGRGKTRNGYIMSVAAEHLSADTLDDFCNADMQRGLFLEDWAGRAFTACTGLNIHNIGFVLHDDERIGCSPDGLIGDQLGIEIKCPRPRQHINNILGDGMSDYAAQAQGCMWVCDRQGWYLVSFCPWVKQKPLHIEMIERDDALIERIADSALRAADEVDAIVARAMSPNTTTTPAIHDIATRAIQAYERTLNNGEVMI